MEQDLRRLMLDPNLLAPHKQTLLANIAAQAAAMNMPCYLVGGFVRDLLLGKPVHDLDVIVEGNAIQLGEALVEKFGGKLTPHHKFVTAVWETSSPATPSPITLDLITARSETYAYPGALPTVKPAAIQDDIRRRDFTINALALRLDGELLDPLNGQADLASGIIRVLHPRSFMDDPTRIFRAIRYEQRYGFRIEAATLAAIDNDALGILATLSGERIRHELDLIFQEEHAARMLTRLKDLFALEVFNLPGFDHAALLDVHPPPEFELAVSRVELGYLLWLMETPIREVTGICQRLDFTAELSQAALAAAQLKSDLPEFDRAQPGVWTFHLEKFPPVAVYAVWLAAGIPALREFLVKWRHIKPTLNGNDLKARGIPPGPRYKEILARLRAAWLDGQVQNQTEEIELLNTLL